MVKLSTVNTRSTIAIMCCLACFYYIDYIIKHYGHKLEILTLIIGLIGGTMVGNVLAFYFGGTNKSPRDSDKNETTP